jgi:transglutaminase-like putative cysteine protease
MNRLHYSVNLLYEVEDDSADLILNIEAARTARQTIVWETLTLPPWIQASFYTDPLMANRLIRLHARRGTLEVRYEALVQIDHRLDDPWTLSELPIAVLPFEVLPFLAPSRYCESDRLMEFALREFGSFMPGYARVLAIKEWVRIHIRYLSSSSNETTSATDTILQRVGVCRDFANLMIALCRALNLPARFASSVDYGADRSRGPADFHAFVEVYLSGGWYLFDPSGISIPTGLLRIGTGHDASEIPFAAIFGKVQSSAPYITITAVTDVAYGLQMPGFTPLAIGTW